MKQGTIFLEGPAGSGKTTWGCTYLAELLAQPSGGVMLLVPQKILADPYLEVIRNSGEVFTDVFTIGSLSRNMVEMYWPMVSEDAGFSSPEMPPTFLNLEGAQYFIAFVLRPLFEEGFFESVTISRNRLYTQVLDNLNKAALNGYWPAEIGGRLALAVIGDSEQQQIYRDAQVAAENFREFCLENNFVDFSLQVEIFWRYLWGNEGGICRNYLENTYQHLIIENLEETTPVEHVFIREFLPNLRSVLAIYDTEAGYRTFLGADSKSAYQLQNEFDQNLHMDDSLVMPLSSDKVAKRIGAIMNRHDSKKSSKPSLQEVQQVFAVESHRYFPDMLDWVVDQVRFLMEEQGVPAKEIVILSPFLSDALRYSLSEKLASFGVETRSHRPSRSLRDEPVSQALITLSKLGYPSWNLVPSKFDVAYMFLQVISGMDLVRAQLLAEVVLHNEQGEPSLSPFNNIKPDIQARITFLLGERYEHLRAWLANNEASGSMELDFFLGRVFGEVLAQPGFGFHNQFSAGETTANLVDSIKQFRLATDHGILGTENRGKEYIKMVQDGVIAAQYLRSWRSKDENAVQLLPAYTFLMQNQAVDYQFWLDIGSYGWYKRIYQPITHPHVLNRHWPKDQYWTDTDEVENEQDALYRLVTGLMRRCRGQIYLGLSDLSESGYENEGLLLKVLHRLYQQAVAGR